MPYHMVHYWRAVVPAGTGGTFEGLCRSALNQADAAGRALWIRASDRLFEPQEEKEHQLLLNRVADLSSSVFGEICLLQQGGFQALLELQASQVQLSNLTLAEVFDVVERSAPTGSQFIRGIAYWLSVGNHVFFVKLQSMNASHVRTYLDWLLRTRTATIPTAAEEISFVAEFDRSLVRGDIGDIKSIRVGGLAVARAERPRPDSAEIKTTTRIVETARYVGSRAVEFDQAISIVENLFGTARTESLVSSLGSEEYLAVDASVKIRGRRTIESRESIKRLANEVADLTDGKVQVEGKDGNGQTRTRS